MRQRQFRTYLDYCAGGDVLYGLSDHFIRMWQRRNLEVPDAEYDIVPECFVWHILRSIVDACIVLQDGTLDGETENEAWKAITHLDLSAANLFLQPSEDAAALLSVLVSDFGFSFFDIDHKDTATNHANPYDYTTDNSGTMNYAPEHTNVRYRPDGTAMEIGEKTDVWAIGSLSFKIVSNTHPREPRCDYRDPRNPHVIYNVPVTARNYGRFKPGDTLRFTQYPAMRRYSITLITIMAMCLN